MASTTTALVTFADFEQLPEPAAGRYELRHGEIITVPPPKSDHEEMTYVLRVLLEKAAGEDFVVREEMAFRSGDHDYRVVMWGFCLGAVSSD